jgi:hypothetical protein
VIRCIKVVEERRPQVVTKTHEDQLYVVNPQSIRSHPRRYESEYNCWFAHEGRGDVNEDNTEIKQATHSSSIKMRTFVDERIDTY